MAEYIDREVVLNAITADGFEHFSGCLSSSEVRLIELMRDSVSEIPAADVAPVVRGRWVHDHYEDCTEEFEIVKCSNCGYTAYAMALFVKSGNFCPNCGARMEG